MTKRRINIEVSMGNRTYCDCLQELRDFIVNTKLTERQQLHVLSILEELQTYGNRMEAALRDNRDLLHKYKNIKKLDAAIRKKQGELRRLENNE